MKSFKEYIAENITNRWHSNHTSKEEAVKSRAEELGDMGHSIHHQDGSHLIHMKDGQKFKTTASEKNGGIWMTQERI